MTESLSGWNERHILLIHSFNIKESISRARSKVINLDGSQMRCIIIVEKFVFFKEFLQEIKLGNSEAHGMIGWKQVLAFVKHL
ncbi:hypothetical protein TNCV_3141911 [Trichonephila clavipes]|nr:hypothetical protein TNCV_3141911 [Trichonephila clavipes]